MKRGVLLGILIVSIFIVSTGVFLYVYTKSPSQQENNQSASTLTGNQSSVGLLNNVVDANNQFGLDLYSKYQSKEGNVFFSPYSISSALAMTY